MIKGCTKRVIVVKDVDSKFFDEAFFIVRPGLSKTKYGEEDYLSEAGKIVRKNGEPFAKDNPPYFAAVGEKKKRRSRLRDLLLFFFGFWTSVVLCSLIYYSGILI